MLDESTEAFVGELLRVGPFYGWSSADGSAAPVPEPSRLRLVRLWSWRGGRRGGVARVEEPGHPLDGFWVVFSTRHPGRYDFTNRTGDYIVNIGPEEPVDDEEGRPLLGSGTPRLDGFAEVRVYQGGYTEPG